MSKVCMTNEAITGGRILLYMHDNKLNEALFNNITYNLSKYINVVLDHALLLSSGID